MISLRQIIEAITGRNILAGNTMITEFVIDSRKAIPGSFFIALKGDHSDGHNYIESAFRNGAQISLINQEIPGEYPVIDLRNPSPAGIITLPKAPFCIRVADTLETLQTVARWWRSNLYVRVIGITGSVGKSSTKELTAEVLGRKYATFKNPGNYNNEIGLPLTILNTGQGFERIVLEMGFYCPGEIEFLCSIAKPDIGIITNIGTVHAERAGSRENIAEGKSELVRMLPPAPSGIAVLNYDDPFVKAMAKKTKADILFYGLSSESDIWADDIHGKGLQGIEFRMHYDGKSAKLTIPILGRHSVQTILRASAVGFIEGLNWDDVIAGLTFSNTQLRLVAVETQSGALILDDTYNATPESTIAALDLLNELKGQKIAVLGDMLELGQYEETGHLQVGRKAAEVVDHLIAVGERSQSIAESAKASGLPGTAVTWVKNAEQAVDLLIYNLKDGDIVLIKGSHGLRMDLITSKLEAVL
jgi:UDP-N-acetylmuramoyl-tripeptide--D-alanyl-D-alanine ligase